MIVWLARGIKDPLPADPTRHFDIGGAILSTTGLVLVVLGILAEDNNGWLMLILISSCAVVSVPFFVSVRAKVRACKAVEGAEIVRCRAWIAQLPTLSVGGGGQPSHR